jgi:hypothetical protein
LQSSVAQHTHWKDLSISSTHEINYKDGKVRNKFSKNNLKMYSYNDKKYYVIRGKKYTFKQLIYLNHNIPTVPLPPSTGWVPLNIDPDYEINKEERLIRTRRTGKVLKNFDGSFKIKSRLCDIDDLINNRIDKVEPDIPFKFPKQPDPSTINLLEIITG